MGAKIIKIHTKTNFVLYIFKKYRVLLIYDYCINLMMNKYVQNTY